MYLHKDWELFQEVVSSTSATLGIPVPVVEKDYYVTMILKLLAEKADGCVFKGGTSLAKCHHVIKRFSEKSKLWDFSENPNLNKIQTSH